MQVASNEWKIMIYLKQNKWFHSGSVLQYNKPKSILTVLYSMLNQINPIESSTAGLTELLVVVGIQIISIYDWCMFLYI